MKANSAQKRPPSISSSVAPFERNPSQLCERHLDVNRTSLALDVDSRQAPRDLLLTLLHSRCDRPTYNLLVGRRRFSPSAGAGLGPLRRLANIARLTGLHRLDSRLAFFRSHPRQSPRLSGMLRMVSFTSALMASSQWTAGAKAAALDMPVFSAVSPTNTGYEQDPEFGS